MQSRLEEMPKRYFVGIRNQMSLVNNTTLELWKKFMPEKGNIKQTIGEELYSMEVYPRDYFQNFNPAATFEKWAAVEVKDKFILLDEMEYLTVPAGLYVVFHYVGSPKDAPQAYAFIFKQWLPASDFELDNRPHFAVMGEKYNNESDDSEEEIWIPIKAE